jgi:hypothetical protein
MALRSKTALRESDGMGRKVTDQPRRFLGLYLAPLFALPFSWLIHLWAFGINWRGQTYGGSRPLGTATLLVFGVAMTFLVIHANRSTAHREPHVRQAFTATMALLSLLLAWNVGTGPHYVISGAFLIVSWILASFWVIPRLNVARKESREDGEEKDGFWKRLGVSAKTKMRAKVIHDEKTGEPERLEVDFDHAEGETLEAVIEGLGAMESAAHGPRGMASASAVDGRADRSRAMIPLRDPFRSYIPLGPLSAPGKSVGEFVTFADYADGKPALLTLAGGLVMPNNSSIGVIGMTRTGKGITEMNLLTEHGSRCDWVCLYLNQAKGSQDVRPLLPVIEAAVIAEDGEQGLGTYITAFKQVEAIMNYRQHRLSQFGITNWSVRCGSPDPAKRPSRVMADGRREVMESLPLLTVWVGEADAILANGRASDAGKFIASKSLSLGINSGWSLQNPDWQSMPTGLRAQIGTWLVHGLSSDDHAQMVLSDSVRKAGARPEEWGQTKPGQLYIVGAGVPDSACFPVAAKTRFLVGELLDANGNQFDFDTLTDRFIAEILRRNLQSAKTMAKLDRGSVDATGGWWDEQVRATAALRSDLLTPQSAPRNHPATTPQSVPQATPQSATRNPQYVPPGLRGRPVPQPATVDDDEPTADEMTEMHEEAAEVRDVEGIELYEDRETEAIDLTQEAAPLPDVADEDDPLHDPDDEARPAPRTRAEAVTGLADAFDACLADPTLLDPADPTGQTVIVTPGLVFDRYRLRSRPWVSGEFALIAEGQGDLAKRYVLTLAEDLGIRRGKYRLRRAGDHTA